MRHAAFDDETLLPHSRALRASHSEPARPALAYHGLEPHLPAEDTLTRHLVTATALAFVVALGLTLAIFTANARSLVSVDFLRALGGLVLFAGLPVAAGLVLVAWLAERAAPLEGRGWLVAAALALAASVLLAMPGLLSGRVTPEDVAARRVPAGVFFLGLFLLASRGIVRAWPIAAITGVAAVAGTLVALAGGLRVREPEPAPVAPPPTLATVHPQVLLIGIDGLGWETLERWLAEGGSEDYRWLVANQAITAPLATLTPTESPRIWTTMATGRPPEVHGAIAFTSHHVVGLDRPLPELPSGEGAFFWLRIASESGLVTRRPIGAIDTRCPTFWELAADGERVVDVVGWWCTWPAESIRGRIVSDRFFFLGDWAGVARTGATHPASLGEELAPLHVRPRELSPELLERFVELSPDDAARFVLNAFDVAELGDEDDRLERELPRALAMDETHYAIAERFLETKPEKSLRVFYFRGVDLIGHSAMHHSTLYEMDPRVSSPEQRARFGQVVARYYAYTFERIRRLVERAGENAVVLIVSDHGFQRTPRGTFAHPSAPPGVLIARLPVGFAPLPPRDPTVYDVAPTLLWLAGLPVAEDMPGSVWTSLFGRDPDDVALIPSYGTRTPTSSVLPAGSTDVTEEIELLRSLGYIQ